MGEYSDLLYARPSFIEGIARIVDLGGTLNEYNRSPTPDEADFDALEADWRMLGQDLEQALAIYKASRPELIDGSK
jgi:hypothetical protein